LLRQGTYWKKTNRLLPGQGGVIWVEMDWRETKETGGERPNPGKKKKLGGETGESTRIKKRKRYGLSR